MKLYVLVQSAFCRQHVVAVYYKYTEALSRSVKEEKRFHYRFGSVPISHIIEERELE